MREAKFPGFRATIHKQQSLVFWVMEKVTNSMKEMHNVAKQILSQASSASVNLTTISSFPGGEVLSKSNAKPVFL